jgi:hypothetical protein
VRLSLGPSLLALVCVSGCSFSVDGLPMSPPSKTPDLASSLDLSAPPPDLTAPLVPADLQVAPAGTLVLTSTLLTTAQQVLLTTDGSRDWVHWGYTTATDIDRKLSGGSQIGDYTIVGTGTPMLYTDNIVGFNWTDGAPHLTSGGAQTSGVYLTTLNDGFRLSVPAAATRRTLLVFVGGYHSVGRLTALLSDASAASVSDDTHGNPSGKYTVQQRFDFAAATAGQSLIITWVQESGDAQGNVTLQAAALADAP